MDRVCVAVEAKSDISLLYGIVMIQEREFDN